MRSIIEISKEIECIEERIKLIKESSGSGRDPTGNQASAIADYESKLLGKTEQLKSEIKKMETLHESQSDWRIREILMLRLVHGYSYRKISKLVGMSPTGVMNRIKTFEREVNENG